MASERKLPSKDRKDCPKEACLRFTIVDYWGDPIDPAPSYELEGYGEVRPDTDIAPLSEGYHSFRAKGGEEYEKMKKLPGGVPYKPKGANFLNYNRACGRFRSPAERKARTEGHHYMHASGLELWEAQAPAKGYVMHAGCRNKSSSPCECEKTLVEYTPPGLDYIILMAFLDNHSGDLHGSGHAGALIIDGESKTGLFADFGPYNEVPDFRNHGEIVGLAEVRTLPFSGPLLLEDLRLNELALGGVFQIINANRGSGIVSKKSCIHIGLEGPAHPVDNALPRKLMNLTLGGKVYNSVMQNIPGFKIHGIIAWAAIPLHKGAYGRMLARVTALDRQMRALDTDDPNGYSFGYNCMTFALDILHTGLGSDCPLGERGSVMDHPNDHIGRYMSQAAEAGFFNHRMAEGYESPFEKAGDRRSEAPGIRHHNTVPCVSFVDKKSNGPPPAER